MISSLQNPVLLRQKYKMCVYLKNITIIIIIINYNIKIVSPRYIYISLIIIIYNDLLYVIEHKFTLINVYL